MNSNIKYNANKNNLTEKEKNKIIDCRNYLQKNYYKAPYLKIQCYERFSYIGNKVLNSMGINNIQKSNVIYGNKDLSDKELYQMFGTYNASKDKDGKTIFFTDSKLYKQSENVKVTNFINSINGFANIGNSCYMNSFLQILFHTPYFLEYIEEYKDYDSNTLIYNIKFLSKYPYKSQYLYKIKSIMGEVNSKYGTFNPGDSQSFAVDFIDQLISECKDEFSNDESVKSSCIQSKAKSYKTFCEEFHNKKDKIERLFQFTEIAKPTTFTGNYNFSININIELCFPLNCSNPIDIYTLLNGKYSRKDINKENKPKLCDLPEILIITIIRGIEGRGVIKTKVSFNENLDLSPYLDYELASKLKNKAYYKLYAINERFGQYKSQGHYICFIKLKGIKWYRFSDLWVTPDYPDFCSSDVFGLYYIRNDLIKTYI